jgi:hypothetical protein
VHAQPETTKHAADVTVAGFTSTYPELQASGRGTTVGIWDVTFAINSGTLPGSAIISAIHGAGINFRGASFKHRAGVLNFRSCGL